MESNTTSQKKLKELNNLFYKQLKEQKRVKDVQVLNRNELLSIEAIGGRFLFDGDQASFFYSKTLSFTAINFRLAYVFTNKEMRSQLELMLAVNKYNESTFGIKACLLDHDTEDEYSVELNVESTLSTNNTGKYPLDAMFLILARGKSQFHTFVEAYFSDFNGVSKDVNKEGK